MSDSDIHKAPAEAGRLDFLRPRARTDQVRVRKSIGWLRLGLPVLAGLVMLTLILWPMIGGRSLKSLAMKNIPDLVIQNLHFTGLDSKNEPYSLIAAKATRPGGFKNVYDFDKPEAEITLQNGAWISGKAQQGRYDQDAHQLWLGGDVQLFHDKGYQFTTEEAQVDLKDDDAWGEKPVVIQGSFGEIHGQGFRLLDSGKEMVVKGPATATLDLHGGSDKPGKPQ